MPHFLLDGKMIYRACTRPNQLRRVFRAVWMFYMCKNQQNELVVSIATLAIVALSFQRFYHVVCARANKVPLAKRVPIRERKLRAWY